MQEQQQQQQRQRQQRHVVVVGGGIGGLGAALALQRAGISVRVYEKDCTFADRKQGYGLTLTNNRKGPLQALGLLDDCIAADCASTCHYVFTASGDIWGYYGRAFNSNNNSSNSNSNNEGGAGQDNNSGGLRGNLRIPRQMLRQLLLDRLQPDTIQWGRRIIDYTEQPDAITVRFAKTATREMKDKEEEEEEETVRCDVLVGADGINSVVRRLRDAECRDTGSALRYLGVAVIIGLSTATDPLISRRGFYALDGTQRIFIMPFREQPPLTMWQLSFSDMAEAEAIDRLRRNATPAALRALAADRTSRWMAAVGAIIAATPDEYIWGTPLYDRDPMHVFTKKQPGWVSTTTTKTTTSGDDDKEKKDKTKKKRDDGAAAVNIWRSRVTVVGDACHPMSMFKGQGANQALEDGPLLAAWLGRLAPSATAEQLATCLRCFEREMVARAAAKVLASRQAARHLHSPAALADRYGIEGCGDVDAVLAALRTERIGAWCGAELDSRVAAVISRCSLKRTNDNDDNDDDDEDRSKRRRIDPSAAAGGDNANDNHDDADAVT